MSQQQQQNIGKIIFLIQLQGSILPTQQKKWGTTLYFEFAFLTDCMD